MLYNSTVGRTGPNFILQCPLLHLLVASRVTFSLPEVKPGDTLQRLSSVQLGRSLLAVGVCTRWQETGQVAWSGHWDYSLPWGTGVLGTPDLALPSSLARVFSPYTSRSLDPRCWAGSGPHQKLHPIHTLLQPPGPRLHPGTILDLHGPGPVSSG